MSVVTQYKATTPQQKAVAFTNYARRFVIGVADLTSGAYHIPVEAGQLVLRVRAVITKAWNGAGTIDVGDGVTADLFIANANITEGTVGSVAASSSAGKFYTAVGEVRVTVGGAPTVGEVVVYIDFDGYDLGKQRGEINNLG